MKWKRIKAFIIRDLKITFRDKAIIFWMIVWPIIWIFMLAYVFIPPSIGEPMTLDLGVVNHDTSATAFNGSTFIIVLNESKYKDVKMFNVKIYSNESALKYDLKKGKLDLGIVIPDKFGENITFGQAKFRIHWCIKPVYKPN